MNILITGTSGFLGIRALRYLSGQYACFAPSHQQFDLGKDDKICRMYIEEKQPDVIVHLAAISEISKCEKNPELSKKVNVDGPTYLAKICRDNGIRLIFASSDQVYTGSKAKKEQVEADVCHPTNVYAQHKYLEEQQILDILPNAVGLRMSWMYDLPDKNLKVKPNFAVNIMESLMNQTPQYISAQSIRSVTYAQFVIENIGKIISSPNFPGGIYNFGSPCEGNFWELHQKAYQLAGEFKNMPYEGLCLKSAEGSFRNLSMDQSKLNAQRLYFPDALEAFCMCLQDHKND